MNTPGTMGPPNWTWRFTWDMVGPEPGRVLGLMTRVSGRSGTVHTGSGAWAAAA
jgi:4-alpha-glucanotransferase